MSKKSGKSIRGECRTEKGKPRHSFYLGTDAREAERRKEHLERLGECVEAKDGAWTPLSLYIGKAIAKGATEVNVSEFFTGAFAEHAHHALANYQADYPVIRLVVSEQVEKERQAFGKILQADADKYLSRPISSVTVHQAIDDYSEFCKRTILDVATKELSDYGKQVLKRLDWLKENYADRPLNEMDIDEILAIWKSRPITKKKKPCSIDHARGVIKTFRNFLDWLHGRYEWRKPENYRVKPIRFSGVRQHKVSVHTRDELITLYRYATPLERVFLLLGLNCGFAQSEIAHLRKDMLSGNHVKGARNKTGVYGEWELWPETIAALEWYAKNHLANPEYVFTNKKGLPLFTRTSGGNRNQLIANTWKRLLGRVKREEAHKTFRQLPFKFLRKTSGNWCRKIAGGETMRVLPPHQRRHHPGHRVRWLWLRYPVGIGIVDDAGGQWQEGG